MLKHEKNDPFTFHIKAIEEDIKIIQKRIDNFTKSSVFVLPDQRYLVKRNINDSEKGIERLLKRKEILKKMQRKELISQKEHEFLMLIPVLEKNDAVKNYRHVLWPFVSCIETLEKEIERTQKHIDNIMNNKHPPEKKGMFTETENDEIVWVSLDDLKKENEDRRKRVEILKKMQKRKVINTEEHKFLMRLSALKENDAVKNYRHVRHFVSYIKILEEGIEMKQKHIDEIVNNKLPLESKGIYTRIENDEKVWVPLDNLKKANEGQRKRVEILKKMQRNEFISPEEHALLMQLSPLEESDTVKNYPFVQKIESYCIFL
jgi:hypothetical protein